MPLPVPTDIMRVRLRAKLTVSEVEKEEAQFGFWGQLKHISGTSLDWQVAVDTAAAGIRDRWNEHVRKTGFFSQAVVMDYVKVDHLAASNGSILHQGVAEFTGDDAWRGSGSFSLPWECSLAVSLFGYSAGFTPDKGRKRGRFYLPAISTTAVQSDDGQLTTGATTQIRDDMVAFLNDVQGMHLDLDPGDPGTHDYFDLGVVSRGTPAKPLPPTFTPITRIRVDSKIDSQRRRERQQDPNLELDGTIAHS